MDMERIETQCDACHDATGELLVSEAAYSAAAMDVHGLEERNLILKGRSEPLRAVVIRK